MSGTTSAFLRVGLSSAPAHAAVACAVCIAGAARAAEVERDASSAFVVAVAHGTYAGGRHQDEFDGALGRLGWPAGKYPSTKEGLARLAADLPGCDMVLFCPLFNYDPAEDVTVHAGRFAEFVRGGGAVVITDANYPQAFKWLNGIAPSLDANTKSPCQAKSPPSDDREVIASAREGPRPGSPAQESARNGKPLPLRRRRFA